jgi:hypothetical protein
LRLQASTLCVHGDNDSSVAAVRHPPGPESAERHEAAYRSGRARQPDGASVRCIDEANMPWMLAASQRLRSAFGEHLIDLVPSYTTLMVHYDLSR